MMGALGNGRRGGRSPSLLMGALIACILLLGFNYWVSNSRNIELQSRILELEDRMRMLAADRDREQLRKMKVEDEMRAQNERMELVEDTHRKQQDTAMNSWIQEKEVLKLNISSSGKTLQEMKNHMKSLFEDLTKRQNELKFCQTNAENFMTQYNKKIETLKENCIKKAAGSKLEEAEKEPAPGTPKNASSSAQNLAAKPKSELPETKHSDKNMAEPLNSEPEVELQNEVLVQNNEELVEKDKKALIVDNSNPTHKPTNKNETLDGPKDNKVPETATDIKGKAINTDTLLGEAGILDDDIGLGDGNEEIERIGEGREDILMYDNDREIEKQLSKIKDENQGAGQDLEDEMAIYNGDDDNQPESEDDKQAELTGM